MLFTLWTERVFINDVTLWLDTTVIKVPIAERRLEIFSHLTDRFCDCTRHLEHPEYYLPMILIDPFTYKSASIPSLVWVSKPVTIRTIICHTTCKCLLDIKCRNSNLENIKRDRKISYKICEFVIPGESYLCRHQTKAIWRKKTVFSLKFFITGFRI